MFIKDNIKAGFLFLHLRWMVLMPGVLAPVTIWADTAESKVPPVAHREAGQVDSSAPGVHDFNLEVWKTLPSDSLKEEAVLNLVKDYNQTLADYQKASQSLARGKQTRILLVVAALFLVLVFFLWKVIGQASLKRRITALEVALKKKDQSDKLVFQKYFTTLSHEIRTPLNGISGMAQLLTATPLTEKQEEYLNLLKVSSQQLTANITDLIEYNRENNSSSGIESLPFEIQEVVGQVLDMASEKAAARRIGINVFTDTRIPRTVVGDAVILRHVLSLLLRDAVSFSRQHDVGLRVEMLSHQNNQVELKFVVSGSGSLPDDVVALFSDSAAAMAELPPPFFDQTREARLGRAFALVRMMNGVCTIGSQAGEGSHISVVMRFDVAENRTIDQPRMSLAGLRVLLIDENMTSRSVFRHYLTFFGCRTDEASSFEQGFSLLYQAGSPSAYQVVLINIREMEPEVLEKIRHFKSQPDNNLVCFFLTASTGLLLAAGELKRFGISAFLNKPVSLYDLYDTIERWVLPSSASGQPPRPRPESANAAHTGLQILLAEDNLISEKVATATLNRLGHSVDVAENGKVVLQKTAEKRYDLILMDIEMPEMNGIEATLALRKASVKAINGEPVPVVALTANAMPNDREKCLKAGMNGYISKPFKHEELIKILKLTINTSER